MATKSCLAHKSAFVPIETTSIQFGHRALRFPRIRRFLSTTHLSHENLISRCNRPRRRRRLSSSRSRKLRLCRHPRGRRSRGKFNICLPSECFYTLTFHKYPACFNTAQIARLFLVFLAAATYKGSFAKAAPGVSFQWYLCFPSSYFKFGSRLSFRQLLGLLSI